MNERRQALELPSPLPARTRSPPRKPYVRAYRDCRSPKTPGIPLAALRERVATTLSIARERMRQAEDDPESSSSDVTPTRLDREAAGHRSGGGAVH